MAAALPHPIRIREARSGPHGSIRASPAVMGLPRTKAGDVYRAPDPTRGRRAGGGLPHTAPSPAMTLPSVRAFQQRASPSACFASRSHGGRPTGAAPLLPPATIGGGCCVVGRQAGADAPIPPDGVRFAHHPLLLRRPARVDQNPVSEVNKEASEKAFLRA